MITIKSAQDIERMKAAGRVVEETLKLLEKSVCVGITTGELNRIAEVCHKLMLSQLLSKR